MLLYKVLLAKNCLHIGGFAGGYLCLECLHGIGISGFALVGCGLGSLTGGNHSGHFGVRLRLSGLAGGDHGQTLCIGLAWAA